MTLLVLYVLLALGVSFLCSVLEAVLLSVTPSYIAALQQKDKKVGDTLAKLKRDIDRPLASILSLNTIAHTVGATGAGAQAAVVFDDTGVGIFSALLTLAILVLSEIIPKTIGATFWRRLAPWAGRILGILIFLMYPLVVMSKSITRLISGGQKVSHTVSREEFTALADLGTREGIIEEEESRVLRNLLRFKSLRVKDIMTPRTVVLAVNEEMKVLDFFTDRPNPRFSRIPVFGENRDDITGYVLKHDMLLELANDRDEVQLKDLKRDVLVVPELLSLRELFERLIETQEHLALVVDEYGGMAGIVTMEDLVETLLGLEIVDEVDVIQDMQVLARQQWYNRAQRLGLVSEDEDIDGLNLPFREQSEASLAEQSESNMVDRASSLNESSSSASTTDGAASNGHADADGESEPEEQPEAERLDTAHTDKSTEGGSKTVSG